MSSRETIKVSKVNTFITGIITIGIVQSVPVGIWYQNDVVKTPMRRHHVASTLIRRHFYVICPVGVHVSYYEENDELSRTLLDEGYARPRVVLKYCVAFTKVRRNLRYLFNELTKIVWSRQLLVTNPDLLQQYLSQFTSL